mgnify:CR=1 FL=1
MLFDSQNFCKKILCRLAYGFQVVNGKYNTYTKDILEVLIQWTKVDAKFWYDHMIFLIIVSKSEFYK